LPTLTHRSVRALSFAMAAIATACGDAPPPTIASIAPTRLCVEGGTVTITGTDFQEGAGVRLTSGATIVELEATFVSETSLTVDTGAQASGTYDVTVVNPDDQEVTLPGALTIFDDPIVFFVDPPVMWNGLTVQSTIYASGIIGDVQSVEIAPTGSTTRQALADFVQDAEHPNRIQVSVPSGLAAGGYDVYVTDEVCEAVLVDGFEVVAETALELAAIDPPFGWTGADTAVTITADTTTAPGFAATPRVYFSPSGGGVAQPGRAVAFQDDETISAIVPRGLAAGSYDVIVINPDATVGVLTEGFLVTADPPPSIEEATPGQIDSDTVTAITLNGSGFSAGAEVTLFCVDSGGVALPDAVITPSAVAVEGDELTFDSPTLDAGTVCVVRVTNAATDDTYGDFSAISVTNPASNLEPFQTSDSAPDLIQPMTTGRVGLGLVAGRVSATQRYLFAIGGADADGDALDTVESTQVDLFGRMLGWQVQAQGDSPRPLTTPRAELGAVRIGQYLYVAGGTDGTAALDSIERARILDPLQVPALDDVEITLDETSGLEAGSWVYRIAAVTDPDGESLPSEPINITIPALEDAAQHIQVTVSWTEVPGATAYRVYRTRAPGEGSGDVAFLAEVTDGLAFTDDGSATPATDARPPLAIGALGEWHVVGTMLQGRNGAAVAAASGDDDTEWFLYVAGGHDGTNVLDTYEYVSVTIDPADGSQDVGDTVDVGAKAIGDARWHLAAWTVDDSILTEAGDDSYVYFGVGQNAAGDALVNATVVGRVDSTGELISTDDIDLDALPTSAFSGVAAVAASGFLYELGGWDFVLIPQAPTRGGATAEICRIGLGGCSEGPPSLRNWNALGEGSIVQARYLSAAAIESAFIFVAGGTSDGTNALVSVERTIR
jgi:hypothetical protein